MADKLTELIIGEGNESKTSKIIMNKIFIIVRDLLLHISSITKLTYNEINILMYYYIVPLFYLSLIDYKLNTHNIKILFISLILLSFLLIKDFKKISDFLFLKSVAFLRWFEIIGWNYIVSSVIICVFTPILILVLIFII
ncbi:MAG: hypothetical protein HOA12_06045 [Candidatus Marinimicrobia bacterium]|jgi:hypothetical protein|nr:hypothetical protein [Candidatus Neomarinimicrobiota bacterium]MBT6862793.1 hypothetical protein [Candidatus Neomarinimicrobiota bacterium]